MLDLGGFQTSNKSLLHILSQIDDLSQNPRVLITGAAGSGKKQLIQLILSKKKSKKVVRFNKGVPIESFDQALVIIVENVEALSVPQQHELIRLLKSAKMRNHEWIFTAESELRMLASKGLLDQRLLGEVSQIVAIPQLSERKEDILDIAENILQTNSWILGRIVKLSARAKEKIQNYEWPGSVRELQEILEKAAFKNQTGTIEEAELEIESSMEKTLCTLAEMEKKLIFQTLKVTQQNRTKAADILGISIRTLRNKLSQYRQEEMHEPNV